MPEWIDSPAEALTILSIAGVLFAALLWLIKAQIVQTRELKPNHGSSMRDAVDRIEASLREIKAATAAVLLQAATLAAVVVEEQVQLEQMARQALEATVAQVRPTHTPDLV